MNAEQKQRAIAVITKWWAADSNKAMLSTGYEMAGVLQELIEQLTSVPVLTVECEPDYWSGGHYHEGTKPYIDPTAVWKLPIGTKLYTSPPAPSVPDAALARDAERYRWLRNWTRGAYGIDSNPVFILPHVPTMLDQNIMSGSVAQHLDNAIDAAIERDKLKGGAA